jgi:hypothetical protein
VEIVTAEIATVEIVTAEIVTAEIVIVEIVTAAFKIPKRQMYQLIQRHRNSPNKRTTQSRELSRTISELLN